MDPVGIIGLGLLGSAIAERLRLAGWTVIGFDIDRSRQLEFERVGQIVDSARAVSRQCPRMFLSLPDTAAVATVLAEINSDLRPGAIVLDTTTGDPEVTAEMGRRLASQQVHYLDATVLGSSAQVRTAEVVLMVGGDKGVAESCSELFRSFATRWFHIGPCGSGGKMKLAVNLVLGLNRAALAEGLSFAAHLGLDPSQTLDVLRAGAAYSRVMDNKGPKMLSRDFTPQARLSQHLKDVRLILNAAEAAGAKTPLSDVHHGLLSQLDAAGFGGEDNSAVIRAFE